MKGINPEKLSKTIKPGDDFYHYVNESWFKENPIPASEVRWGTFEVLHKKNTAALFKLVKEVEQSSTNEDERKIGDYYAAAMDIKTINALGAEPLAEELKKIESISSVKDLVALIAHHHVIGTGPWWHPNVEQDDKNSERMVFRLYQDGLGLPDRDYYSKTDKRSVETREKYVEHIVAILKFLKYKTADARAQASKVLELETKLAHASMTRVEERDVHAMYNAMTVEELKKKYDQIPWNVYFEGIGAKNFDDLIVSQPKFIEEVNLLLKTLSLDEWKIYLRWHLIHAYSGTLSDNFAKETFRFYAAYLKGAKQRKPRWKRVMGAIDGMLGEPLGKIYVKKYFTQQAKERVYELVDNITTAYEKRIEALDWMTPATKKAAIEKLKLVVRKLAYPDKWRDYSGLKIDRTSHFENSQNAEVFEFRYLMEKLGKPVNRDEWHMSPSTVNAYYSPNMNEIVFPAGILRFPFFSDKVDDPLNYGAIGAVIGHELSHGFDDQGSEFDGKGNMKKWWSQEDEKSFKEKAEKLAVQFDSYVVIDDVRVNGKLTLGENIADLGGITIAYDALQIALAKKKRKTIDGFTPEQRFFIGWAQMWCESYRPEALREQVLTDPHSPPQFRVNGPLSNMNEFYKAFDIKEGDVLYRSPGSRIEIW